MRGVVFGFLFCESDLCLVIISLFNIELKCCFVFCGLDMSCYKGYSFCIGIVIYVFE